jgi:RimJ/RimL family protein N-acetyltransferase
MDPDFAISTPRLYISHWIATNPAHCAFLVELWNSPLFVELNGPSPVTTPAQAQELITSRFAPNFARNGYGQYLVSLKPSPGASLADSKPIGAVSLIRGEPPNAYKVPDVGFAVVSEAAGKGYAPEAARYLIEYAQKELGVEGVLGMCDPSNARSRRALEKSGLQDRGVHKLIVFGGVMGSVYALPGMVNLREYGIEE